MNDAIALNLLGKEYTWHFNNYALVELGKVLEVSPEKAHAEVMKIAQDDVFMGLAIIVYSGLVGFEKSQFNLRHGITIQNITALMGKVDANEFAPIWEAFKDAMGITEFLESLPEDKSEKKKKSTGGKSSSLRPARSA